MFLGKATPSMDIFGDSLRVGDKVAARRMRLAWHCQRHPYLHAHKLVLWEPTHGHRSRGRPKSTLVDILKRGADEDYSSQELEALIHDRRVWNNLVKARLWPT